MEGTIRIDILKFLKYILKHFWLPVLCAVIGFAGMYIRTAYFNEDAYTANGTLYVYNGNPNLVNYQYASSTDLKSAVQLIDTYLVVIKSNKVMDVVADRLGRDYPGITPEYISDTLTMESISETGVMQIRATTDDPQRSADIVNAVLDVAPDEIIRVVSAGGIEIIDYAMVPLAPNSRHTLRKGVLGAAAGIFFSFAVLLLFFLLNQKITDIDDLKENYTPPVLASVQRNKSHREDSNASRFLLTDNSPMDSVESYAKLRMNLLYSLVGKGHFAVVITSPISGEGKSTVSANLAISCGQSGKKVLLIDADLRRACQCDIFRYANSSEGLTEILVGERIWQDVVIRNIRENVDLLPAGHFPPNPAVILGSGEMHSLLEKLKKVYDLILLDMPPVNIVADPLAVSKWVSGCLFLTRQDYSKHKDIRNALIACEMAGMNVLGFVFYGENVEQGQYYHGRNFRNYYNKYDNRAKQDGALKGDR